jgi:hypothetical protein
MGSEFADARRLKMNTYRKTAITVGALFIIWLIAKGFNQSASAALSAKTT